MFFGTGKAVNLLSDSCFGAQSSVSELLKEHNSATRKPKSVKMQNLDTKPEIS